MDGFKYELKPTCDRHDFQRTDQPHLRRCFGCGLVMNLHTLLEEPIIRNIIHVGAFVIDGRVVKSTQYADGGSVEIQYADEEIPHDARLHSSEEAALRIQSRERVPEHRPVDPHHTDGLRGAGIPEPDPDTSPDCRVWRV